MKTLHFIVVFIGALAFNTIFWQEDFALNFALFCGYSILLHAYTSTHLFSRRTVQVSIIGNILACFFLVYHHSLVSMISAIFSWIILIGFLQLDGLRSVQYAFVSSFINFFRLPPFVSKLKWGETDGKYRKYLQRNVKSLFISLVGLLVFYLIFLEANAVFRSFSDQFWHDIVWFFEMFFTQFFGPRIFFFLFGLLVSTWFVYKAYYRIVLDEEEKKTENLFRRRRKKSHNTGASLHVRSGLAPGLKTENRTGSLMMGMIAVLLLFVNVIDVVYVWFGSVDKETQDFSGDVHHGVNLLIFSILLSIFIMVYYFRKNQNFYSKNQLLKKLAYFWILQNAILIVSVVIRNMHYIQYHGLTQKRIGVFVFLLIVLIGLVSLVLKIRDKKSFFYLAKFNSWSLYGVLILLACFNWDRIIFNHNFSNRHKKQIDLTYLVDLSDEVVLHLDKNRYLLFKERNLKHIDLRSRSGAYDFEERLKKIKYELKTDETSFFSWNFRKERMLQLLSNEKL